MNVSKLEVVPIREAFRHEAHNFTVWLEQNIEALSEEIGFPITVIAREKSVGSFNVDLLCEDAKGNTIIVENQLERTDHRHLGQVLTYLVNLEATTAIWVTTDAQPEHQRVMDWLNESTPENMSFYLVEVKAVRIGNSPYAPLFTIVVSPDEQTREIGETKKELAERHHKRLEFWTALLERSQSKTRLFSGKTPGTDHWLSIGAGRTGINFGYLIRKDDAALEVYIDTGDYDRNKAVFDTLFLEKDVIEMEIGEELEWRRLDDKRASNISQRIDGFGSLSEPETWPELQEIMIDAMIVFDRVFRGRIAKIR